ncbi:CBS domain-containing protein [Idiomarina xiamenensis]|uniref:CBS domain-containing protein n=1 Tax=Idiomarina xiamenensis 10-D-4 TaxID=740709 RepID=K2KGD0_9GAMM|nr:CBS domain-containing protein [Idiomarina xiamenensis]EKE87053.1 hypothetical protein A10D4_02387 [Idiomarina xiamenensis 10-D-4]
MTQYTSLSWSAVNDHAVISGSDNVVEKLSWNESAINVLDDFTLKAPLHVHTNTEVSQADAILDAAGSRYACVLDSEGELVGMLSLRDLHGRRAVQIAQQIQVPYKEVPVSYLMKAVASLPLITRKQLQDARIGDAVATLQKSGKDFLLVHEAGHIQGVISSLGIAERTGESVNVYHHASSFAEILHAVKHTEEAD